MKGVSHFNNWQRMLAKRIIPCLDVKNGRTVKGVNFVSLRDAGDPAELAARYAEQGADELVFLDISATVERRNTQSLWVTEVARVLNIPFTVGGGIGALVDAEALLKLGADKVSINSAAVRNPQLVSDISNKLGSQCVVVAIDVRHTPQGWFVNLDGGRTEAPLDAVEWASQAEALGAGELLVTSISKDGTKSGFDLPLLAAIRSQVGVPIIASGGAGNAEHFREVFDARIDAGLAASIFHFGEVSIPDLKQYLSDNQIVVRL